METAKASIAKPTAIKITVNISIGIIVQAIFPIENANKDKGFVIDIISSKITDLKDILSYLEKYLTNFLGQDMQSNLGSSKSSF